MNRLSSLAVAASVFVAAAYADTKDVYGTFLVEAGNAHVTIADCGDGTPCGRVSWADPEVMLDGLTPEEAITPRGEPLIGTLMLEGFEPKKRDWRGGTIYDPENDKTYASRIKRLENGDLQVKGCIGPICQTQVWTEIEVTIETEV